MTSRIGKGSIVRPNHCGTKTDWRKIKGRAICDPYMTEGRSGEMVVDVVWFCGPNKRTNRYPIAMLCA